MVWFKFNLDAQFNSYSFFNFRICMLVDDISIFIYLCVYMQLALYVVPNNNRLIQNTTRNYALQRWIFFLEQSFSLITSRITIFRCKITHCKITQPLWYRLNPERNAIKSSSSSCTHMSHWLSSPTNPLNSKLIKLPTKLCDVETWPSDNWSSTGRIPEQRPQALAVALRTIRW